MPVSETWFVIIYLGKGARYKVLPHNRNVGVLNSPVSSLLKTVGKTVMVGKIVEKMGKQNNTTAGRIW